jgi:hypothetical protein
MASSRLTRVLQTVAVAALLLGLFVTTAAAAPSAAERDTARALMNEGDQLNDDGDVRGALARYQAAHEIMHVPTTGFDVARLQAKLGLLVEARASAMEVVNLPKAASEPEVFEQARRAAAALANELEPRVPSLRTTVAPAEANYSVTIDDVTLPRNARGVAFRTNPGPHSVRVSASGYVTSEQSVRLLEGEARTLAVELTSTLSIASAAPSDAEVERSAQSAASDSSDPGRAGRVRGAVALSISGAVLALGAATGILSLIETHTAAKGCVDKRCPVSSSESLSTANTLANIANVSIPLGVLALGYGVYELVSQPKSSDKPAATQVVIGLGSVSVRGTL